MKISDTTPAAIREAWEECALRIAGNPYVDELAAVILDALYARFDESLVLVRAFLTVPYKALPPRQHEFATRLAASVGLERTLSDFTPVHSLLATRGRLPAWNRPSASRGHVAIPLLSNDFVASIPMMSRLLKELGLPLTWVQDPGANVVKQAIGSEVGFFYVVDAPGAVDNLGRPIITAQDFVAEHTVRTVFAVGGTVFGGAALVLIFFSQDTVDARIARTFMPLVNLMKGVMVSRCSMSRVFRPEEVAAGEHRAPAGRTPTLGDR